MPASTTTPNYTHCPASMTKSVNTTMFQTTGNFFEEILLRLHARIGIVDGARHDDDGAGEKRQLFSMKPRW